MEENEFTPVLEESELSEGSMKGVDVDGTPVLLVKKFGQIYAFDDRCPHQQCQLSHGTLDDLVVVCPCHDWRFNLKTGEYEEEPAITLKGFESKVEAGKIWVKVEENPQ